LLSANKPSEKARVKKEEGIEKKKRWGELVRK
jgi:hypothetical protein